MSCSERQVQEAKLNINTANGKALHIQWKVQVEKQHNGTGVGRGGGYQAEFCTEPRVSVIQNYKRAAQTQSETAEQ